jgi:lysozyme
MMHKMFLLMLAAVFCGGLPAQDMGGMAELLALFNSHPKADIAVELVKKYEGLHDRSDYPCYGYGHRRLPNENLSYDMTEEEAETLLRKDLAVRYKLFRKYKKDALLLTVLSYNVGQGVLLGHGGHPKSRLVRKLEAGNRDIYKEYISFRCWKGKPVRSIERRRKMEFLLLYEP